MKTDLEGRLRNTTLRKAEALYPLFEAIVNSIDAIEESGRNDGRIFIRIEREAPGLPLREGRGEKGRDCRAIEAFRVIDNGIGFTKPNYDSFCTCDSTLKGEKGGKGLGRFLWLKAFREVRVESSFKTSEGAKKRRFRFVAREPGILDEIIEDFESGELSTIVHLREFKTRYRQTCAWPLQRIAVRIVEHCLIHFLHDECPQMSLSDEDEDVSLNALFKRIVSEGSQDEHFSLNDKDFGLRHLKFHESSENRHKLVYCAHKREVKVEPLATHVPDLQKKLVDSENRNYVYLGYISSSYLDETVNVHRTDFDFVEEDDMFDEAIPLADIRGSAIAHATGFLADDLSKVREEKVHAYTEYIRGEAPQYRFLLRHHRGRVEELLPVSGPEKMELELHKLRFALTCDVKAKGERLQKLGVGEIEDKEAYQKEYEEYLRELNEVGKASLAEYICHRKVIIRLIERLLKPESEGKYPREERIHRIVFPLKKTSDEIEFEEQNLWLIDERLSYHRYLASDKSFDSMDVDVIEVESKQRPDILVFDQPLALVDQADPPFSSVSIIEFKRPQRDDFRREKDPIGQIYEYAKLIRDGNARTSEGRPIMVHPSTLFFGYLICDLTEKLRDCAEGHDLKESPDKMGFYAYHSAYNVYLEVISFDKLLRDAKQRNRILFDKLNIL